MLRTIARRACSVAPVRSKILPTRRWKSSGPRASRVGFHLLGYPHSTVFDQLERPYVDFKLLRMSLPRAAPEFEDFVNSIGETKAIVHNMEHACSQVVFADAEKTAEYAAEMDGSIFPPGATIEQGGIPLAAMAVLPSASVPDSFGYRYLRPSEVHLQNMPSLVHPSELNYHEVKEWIEERCGCETPRLALIVRNLSRSDFAEGEMPPAVKAMFDASSREKHAFLTSGNIRVHIAGSKNEITQRFNSLPPAERTFPGAKEPAVMAQPPRVPLYPDNVLYSHTVYASLIPRHVRPSVIDQDAVYDFVKRHLEMEPKRVVVHERPFYPSQFPQDARPPELDGPDSPGVTMLTSGWVSIEFAARQERELAVQRWQRESFAKEFPESTKVFFLRPFARWHESDSPWMSWLSREELDKLTSPHKFLRENANSWNPREPAISGHSKPPGRKASVRREEGPVSSSADVKKASSADEKEAVVGSA